MTDLSAKKPISCPVTVATRDMVNPSHDVLVMKSWNEWIAAFSSKPPVSLFSTTDSTDWKPLHIVSVSNNYYEKLTKEFPYQFHQQWLTWGNLD